MLNTQGWARIGKATSPCHIGGIIIEFKHILVMEKVRSLTVKSLLNMV